MPMRTNEMVWSQRSAMRNADYRNFSQAQQNVLLEGFLEYGAAHRYHAMLATASGEPAGSGVCVTSGGRRGVLTARHVLYADGMKKARLRNPVIAFAPPQGEMIQDHRRRQHRQRNSSGPLGSFQVTGISIGDREIITPLQRKDKKFPDPGLPDIAIILVSDDIEERLRKAARTEGTVAPEPRWVDLDKGDLVGIPYGPTDKDDKMLTGSWLITGLRGERSDVKKFYCETNQIVIDRIYRRGEFEYYGMFVDEVDGKRAQSRDWHGNSGGGVWQQQLTQSGWRKIRQLAPPSLTPDDLEPPMLGGIAFFHEERKSSLELRGDLHGTTYYRGELYAHRIGGMLLDLIRRVLRQEVEMTEVAEREPSSEVAREQGEA